VSTRAIPHAAIAAVPNSEQDDPLGRFENEGGQVLPLAAAAAEVAKVRAAAATETFG
jgi:hypothetical protein